MRYRAIKLVFYEQSAPTQREREETKNKRGRSDSKSHSAHAMIEVFRYVSHYEELSFSGQSRGDDLLCKAC